MIDRTIFRFINPEVQKRYREILAGNFTLTERSKALFAKGEPGQGYVFFLDLTNFEIDLIPAWNPTKEQWEQFEKDPASRDLYREEIKKKFIEYNGVFFGVMSQEPLGSSTGVVHREALKQIKKTHIGGDNKFMLAGGIFKGDSHILLSEVRDKSASQNIFSVEYNEIFLMLNYEPNLLNSIPRSMPTIITEKVIDIFLKDLPAEPTQQRDVASIFNFKFLELEHWFENATDEEIKNKLIDNLIKALEANDNESAKKILSLHEEVPGLLESIIKKEKILANIVAKNNNVLNIPDQDLNPKQKRDKKNIEEVNNFITDLLKMAKEKRQFIISLVDAIKQDNLNALEQLLKNNSKSINGLYLYGETPLTLAIKHKQESIVNFLLKNSFDPNEMNEKKESPLVLAIKAKQINIIYDLINAGVDLNPGNFKNSPLFFSIMSDQRDLCSMIIAKGANLETPDSAGRTPLLLSLNLGKDSNLIELLIDGGANVNVIDHLENSAILLAMRQGNKYDNVALKIIKNADITTLNHIGSGQNPLFLALDKDNKVLIDALINKGVNLEIPLMLLARNQNLYTPEQFQKKMQFLISKGADLKKAKEFAHSKKDSVTENILNQELEKIELSKVKIKQMIDNQLAKLPIHDSPDIFNLLGKLNKIKESESANPLIKDFQKQHSSDLTNSPKVRLYLKRLELEEISKRLKNCQDVNLIKNYSESVTNIINDMKKITDWRYSLFSPFSNEKRPSKAPANDPKIEDPTKQSKKSA